MAVFLYGAVLTHSLSDLSAFLKRRGRIFLALHCALYAFFFIPLFWWMGINLLWLIFIGCSHLLIDSGEKQIHLTTEKILGLKRPNSRSTVISLGLDQVFHLAIIFVIALFVFS